MQRKSPRIPAGGEFVLLQLRTKRGPASENGPEDDDPPPSIYAKVVNISEGGLRLVIPELDNDDLPEDQRPGVGDPVDLVLTGPSLPRPIHVMGEIVSVDPGDEANTCRLSLKFLNLSSHVNEMIKVGLLRLQLNLEGEKDSHRPGHTA